MRRCFSFTTILFIAVWLVSSPALAQESAAANRLFVETVRLVQKADAEKSPKEQVRLYEQALKNLDEIVAKYPYTDISVKLITNQSIGDFSRAVVQEKLKKVRCRFDPAPCIFDQARPILDQAVLITKLIPKPENRFEPLSAIAVAQARLGDIETAPKTLAEADQIIQTILSKTETFYGSFDPVFDAHIKIGDIPGAIRIHEKAEPDRDLRFTTYLRSAEAPAELWNFPSPELSTKKIWTPFIHEKIADKLIQIKKYHEARKVIAHLKNKPAALSKMAEVYFRTGNKKEARLAIQSAIANAKQLTEKKDGFIKIGWAHANIALAHRTLGNGPEARKMIALSLNSFGKIKDFMPYESLSTAKLIFERKYYSAGKQFIDLIVTSINKDQSMSSLNPEFGKYLSSYDEVLAETAKLTKENNLTQDSKSLLSQTAKKVGDLKDPLKQLLWKLVLAKLEILIGTEEKAKAIIAEVLDKKETFGYDKNKYLREIAKIQASTNDVDGALTTVKAIDLESGINRIEAVALKATTLAEIAGILAEKNRKKN